MGGPLGALVIGWDRPREIALDDVVTLTTIAGYAGQALGRAQWLGNRESAAHTLQQALQTRLPDLPGLTMAAAYRPADVRDNVGGDWFDAMPLVDAERPDDLVVAVSVGDIAGHSLEAAAVMGQTRFMLRQAVWDHPGEPPSVALTAFERAGACGGLDVLGSVALAHLRRTPAGACAPTSLGCTGCRCASSSTR